MTAYVADRAGPPIRGRYVEGDVVTDSAGTKWHCVKGGMVNNDETSGGARFAPVLRSNVQGDTPFKLGTTSVLTVADLLSGLILAQPSQEAAGTLQVPAATELDATLKFKINDSIDFSIINISNVAVEQVTLIGNTGVSFSGGTVLLSSTGSNLDGRSSGRWRLRRRTNTPTYTMYRIA